MKNLSLYIREIIYGGNDGIITTFAVVAGFTGAQSNIANHAPISIIPVLLFGFANLFADALSMSLGNFLSIRAEQDAGKNTRKADSHPIISSTLTFCSFILFGCIPLLPFFVAKYDTQTLFIASAIATIIALILLGVVRWKMSGRDIVRSIAEGIIVGGVAATAAFFVGTFFKEV